jgi:hypothetical protein
VFPLVTLVFGVGYTLVYAAVANGGALAKKPWDAFRQSAYQTTGGANTPGAHGAGGWLGTVEHIFKIGLGLLDPLAPLLP